MNHSYFLAMVNRKQIRGGIPCCAQTMNECTPPSDLFLLFANGRRSEKGKDNEIEWRGTTEDISLEKTYLMMTCRKFLQSEILSPLLISILGISYEVALE